MRGKTAIAIATALVGLLITNARATDYSLTGVWNLAHHESNVLPVHAALMPTNEIASEVLIMAGSGNDPTYSRGVNEARLWDALTEDVYGTPGSPPFSGESIPTGDPPTLNDNDIFCSAHVLLPDGRLFAAGGNLEYPSHHGAGFHPVHVTPPNYDSPEARPACHDFLGLRDSFLYDPWEKEWTRGPKMQRGRWYPSLLSLGTGRVLALSGYDDIGQGGLYSNNDLPDQFDNQNCRGAVLNVGVEIYDPATNTWSPRVIPDAGAGQLNTAGNLGLYPYLHLLPDGNVFLAGPTNQTQVFNPNTLQVIGGTRFSARGGWRDYGHSTLLPLRPSDGYAARVLNVGGAGDGVFEKRAEIIDFSEATPQWQLVAPMTKNRYQGVSVLMPDGKVLVAGGGAGGDTNDNAHLDAEMYDPVANTWSYAGTASIPRMYHSVGILLPDGRVFVGGSNPHDSLDPNEHQVEERIEVYSPPYLFKGERADIPDHPEEIHFGASFTIRMSTAAFGRQAAKVVLMRPGSTTHTRNFDQRLVELTMTKDPLNARRLILTAPPNGNIAPPGYYLLFVLNANGVPSKGHILKLS
jgi:hypothetical protein